jgi:hypothetical protein
LLTLTKKLVQLIYQKKPTKLSEVERKVEKKKSQNKLKNKHNQQKLLKTIFLVLIMSQKLQKHQLLLKLRKNKRKSLLLNQSLLLMLKYMNKQLT